MTLPKKDVDFEIDIAGANLAGERRRRPPLSNNNVFVKFVGFTLFSGKTLLCYFVLGFEVNCSCLLQSLVAPVHWEWCHLKNVCLGSNLFSNKMSHKNKHQCKI